MCKDQNKTIYVTDQFQGMKTPSKNQELVIRRRNLPHWELGGAAYFITFRLAGSIPISVINKIREDNELKIKNEMDRLGKMSRERMNELKFEVLMKLDDYLDKNINIRYLANTKVAQIVQDALLYFAVLFVQNTKEIINFDRIKIFDFNDIEFMDTIPRYIFFRWVIMPNHVHVQMLPMVNSKTGKYFELEKILHSIKSYTGNEANKILKREGQFWQHESYDHIIRDEKEFYRIWNYIDYNPVKARLCKSIEDWAWSSACFCGQLSNLPD